MTVLGANDAPDLSLTMNPAVDVTGSTDRAVIGGQSETFVSLI